MISIIQVNATKEPWIPLIGGDRYLFIIPDSNGGDRVVKDAASIIDDEWRDALAFDTNGYRVIVCVRNEISQSQAHEALWRVLENASMTLSFSTISEMCNEN